MAPVRRVQHEALVASVWALSALVREGGLSLASYIFLSFFLFFCETVSLLTQADYIA